MTGEGGKRTLRGSLPIYGQRGNGDAQREGNAIVTMVMFTPEQLRTQGVNVAGDVGGKKEFLEGSTD